jgi:hypothetical protein
VKLAFTYNLCVKNSPNLSSASSTTSRLVHQLVLKFSIIYGKGKGKGRPRTGHEDPDGEQRYSSTLSLTSALDRGVWSTPRSGRFTPGKDPVPIVEETGWAPGPVWAGTENLAPTGIRSPNRPVRSESL